MHGARWHHQLECGRECPGASNARTGRFAYRLSFERRGWAERDPDLVLSECDQLFLVVVA
jgi:hypothetical protein